MVSDTQQEKVWFAREVFQLFVKAFTNLKLYPHHHVHAKTAVGNFVDRVRSFVSLHGVLRLTVGQDTFSIGEDVVYEEENRNENLAFRLYVDGLRELSIAPGVSKEEAERLAHIFYKAVVDTTSDATLLLWEGDFHHIDYAAINSLSEAWDQPDFLSNDSLQQLRDMNHHADDMVAQLTAGTGDRATYAFELSESASEIAELERLGDLDVADESGADESQSGDDDMYKIEEQAMAQLRQDALAWGPDRMLQTVVEASLDGLALEPSLIGRENVRWLLTEALEMALRTSNMDMLSTFLNRLEGELALTEEDEDEILFQYVFEWLGQPQNLSRLTDLAKSNAVGGPQAFTRVLGLLGQRGLPAAINTYLEASNKELETALLEFIGANLHHDPQALAPMLDKRNDPQTVRSGLFLLSKQKLPPEQLEGLLATARSHPHPEVKKYANHLFRTLTDSGTVESYVNALADGETPRERLRALKYVVDKRYRPALDKLKEVVESSKFLEWDPAERKAYLQAIRILGETASIGFLQRQASRRTGVFKRAQVKEIRELAAAELEKLKKRR